MQKTKFSETKAQFRGLCMTSGQEMDRAYSTAAGAYVPGTDKWATDTKNAQKCIDSVV